MRFIHLAKYLAHGFGCVEFKEELNELEKLVVVSPKAFKLTTSTTYQSARLMVEELI